MTRAGFMIMVLLLAAAIFSGCVTAGHRFSISDVTQLKAGQTTRHEAETRLGQPIRTGIDDGDPTASYLFYKFSLFKPPVMQDLTIRYNVNGTVKSVTYSTNTEDAE